MHKMAVGRNARPLVAEVTVDETRTYIVREPQTVRDTQLGESVLSNMKEIA